MPFDDKPQSLNDETRWGDSFRLSARWKVDLDTYSQGSFGEDDRQDYYPLDLPAGEYTLLATTRDLND